MQVRDQAMQKTDYAEEKKTKQKYLICLNIWIRDQKIGNEYSVELVISTPNTK